MGDIFLVDAGARTHRLDLMPPDDGGDGYTNVLPGYHELLVRGDGVWHAAAFVLAADGLAALRLEGATLVDARGAKPPPKERLVDVLRRDLGRARAWQAATSALDHPVVRAEASAAPDPLARLQAAFVRHAVHQDGDAAAEVARLANELVEHAGQWPGAAEMGRSLAAMIQLVPALAPSLPLEDAIGALGDVGVARDDAELIDAANRLQLAVHG